MSWIFSTTFFLFSGKKIVSLEKNMSNFMTLVNGCRNNDRLSQNKLFDILSPPMMKICKRYFSDDYEVEDCMMESLEKMFSNIDRFKGETEESFRCWVKRIVLNTCISKNYSNVIKRNIIPIDENTTMIESGDKPQSSMEYNDFINIVETLSEETREMFKMKEIIGMNYEEIANIIGKTQSSIRMRVFRAKRELREKINKIYY